MSAFLVRWSQNSLFTVDEVKSQFISELSDIVACVLIIMGEEGFDVEKALTECLEKNTARANKKGDKK